MAGVFDKFAVMLRCSSAFSEISVHWLWVKCGTAGCVMRKVKWGMKMRNDGDWSTGEITWPQLLCSLLHATRRRRSGKLRNVDLCIFVNVTVICHLLLCVLNWKMLRNLSNKSCYCVWQSGHSQCDKLHCRWSRKLITGLPPSSDAWPLYHCITGDRQALSTARFQRGSISASWYLLYYITVSYQMTVDLGLQKNSFMAWIARRHQLNWNNSGHIHVMKCCDTLLNKCQLYMLQMIPRHALPLTHSLL